MADKPQDEPKQTTRKGLEIPVPTREDFLRNLDRVAQPEKPASDEPEKG